ncbi:MAG: flagellar motor protein [Vampirovibrionales bacterium]|nr:flagellar motor protein [Vampirovibrionales bacterium]
MDLTSIIGIILGIAAVVGGQVLEGGSLAAIVQPTAFIIVMGGTIGAVALAFPMSDCMNALKALPGAFGADKETPEMFIDKLVELANKARKEGLLALQNDIKSIEHPFLKKGLELMTDGTDPALLRDLLETELSFFEDTIGQNCKFYETAGGFTPTVGILGAVLGLIHVMENLSDPSKLGSGIAVAFVATVYGVGFANLIFIPLGSKIKFKGKFAIHARHMMIEGIMAIQAGESPSFIRQKLAVFCHGDHHEAEEGK